MRVVIAPDSFKGSLDAARAAAAMARGIRRVWPDAEIRLLPMADGGEGTLEAVLAATGGARRELTVTGGHGRPLSAAFGLLADGTAVIEAARVVGITLPGMLDVPVAERATRGLGELVAHCLDLGARRFLVGLGGSATNDGGCGMLAALGVVFLDESGAPIPATLQGLAALVSIDFGGLDARLTGCDITMLSDVDNPLCGARGATEVFGPQKGVAAADAQAFDQRLHRLADLCAARSGPDLALQPGSGTAGGLGFALRLVGGKSSSGAEAVCELIGLDDALRGADWALTGEGHSDAQTLHGKAPWVVARHARRLGVPVTLISGSVDAGLVELATAFDGCYSLLDEVVTLEQAMRDADALLAERAATAARSHGATL